jgi:hypothetical protein
MNHILQMDLIAQYKSSGEDSDGEDFADQSSLKNEEPIKIPKKDLKKQVVHKKRQEIRRVIYIDCSKCRFKCSLSICKDRQEMINKNYWIESSFQHRKNFITSFVSKDNIKRRYLAINNDAFKRNNNFVYHLTDESGKRIRVCKAFFFGTLGYNKKSDRILRTCFKFDPEDRPIIKDKRGSYAREKADTEMIQSHIMSYEPENHSGVQRINDVFHKIFKIDFFLFLRFLCFVLSYKIKNICKKSF